MILTIIMTISMNIILIYSFDKYNKYLSLFIKLIKVLLNVKPKIVTIIEIKIATIKDCIKT